MFSTYLTSVYVCVHIDVVVVVVMVTGHLSACCGDLQCLSAAQRLGFHPVVQHADHRAQGEHAHRYHEKRFVYVFAFHRKDVLTIPTSRFIPVKSSSSCLPSSPEPEVLPHSSASEVVAAVRCSQLAVLLRHQARPEPGAAQHAGRQAARYEWQEDKFPPEIQWVTDRWCVMCFSLGAKAKRNPEGQIPWTKFCKVSHEGGIYTPGGSTMRKQWELKNDIDWRAVLTLKRYLNATFYNNVFSSHDKLTFPFVSKFPVVLTDRRGRRFYVCIWAVTWLIPAAERKRENVSLLAVDRRNPGSD